MPNQIVQDDNGNFFGVDAVPLAKDAVLVFDAPLIPDLAGHPLYIWSGANSIKWSYELNTAVIDTIAGAVIQILSCFVGPIRIEGQTAGRLFDQDDLLNPLTNDQPAGWLEQSYTPIDELIQITDWFLTYMQTAGTSVTGKYRNESAIHFMYPVRGWDFQIQVTDLEGFAIDKSVISSPWAITAEVVSANAADYFSGVTMGSFVEPLNNKILQDAISPGKEFAHNPFINPSLKVNQDGAFSAAQVFGSDFQGLIASYSTGKFNDWGFSSLQSIPNANYNDKALGPANLPGSNYHVTGGMADYWTKQVGGYWVGNGKSLSDYQVVNGPGIPGQSPGPGPGGGGPPPPTPPPQPGPPPTDCGNSDCYNKKPMKINDMSCLVAAIKKYMQDKGFNPALIDLADYMVSQAVNSGINPFLFPAVAWVETSGGTTGYATDGHFNVWGALYCSGQSCVPNTPSNACCWGSHKNGISEYFKNLLGSTYSSFTTVCEVINKASPPDANPGYMASFLAEFASLLQYAAKCISCGSPPPPPKPKDCKSLGNAVAALAMKNVHHLGDYDENRRVWPWQPFPWVPAYTDCSGFSAAMYDLNGCHIFDGGSYTGSMVGQGEAVQESDLQPGDLIFYNTDSGTNAHMGVYVGGGQLVDMGKNRDDQGRHGAYLHTSYKIYPIYAIRRYCKDCGQS